MGSLFALWFVVKGTDMKTQTSSNVAMAIAAAALLACAGVSQASLLLADFAPAPAPIAPGLLYMGAGPALPSLQPGPASIGNGDGNLPLDQETPGGLLVRTPLPVAGISPGQFGLPQGWTGFRDVTLGLSGLMQDGPAVPAGNLLAQALARGTFELVATHGPGDAPTTLLLTGSIDHAAILSTTKGQGSVLSADVHYDGGVLYNSLAQSLGIKGGPPIPGEMSWSLLNMNPAPLLAGPVPFMPDFTADLIGQFSYIPEPSSLCLFAIATAGLMRRRRR